MRKPPAGAHSLSKNRRLTPLSRLSDECVVSRDASAEYWYHVCGVTFLSIVGEGVSEHIREYSTRKEVSTLTWASLDE